MERRSALSCGRSTARMSSLRSSGKQARVSSAAAIPNGTKASAGPSRSTRTGATIAPSATPSRDVPSCTAKTRASTASSDVRWSRVRPATIMTARGHARDRQRHDGRRQQHDEGHGRERHALDHAARDEHRRQPVAHREGPGDGPADDAADADRADDQACCRLAEPEHLVGVRDAEDVGRPAQHEARREDKEQCERPPVPPEGSQAAERAAPAGRRRVLEGRGRPEVQPDAEEGGDPRQRARDGQDEGGSHQRSTDAGRDRAEEEREAVRDGRQRVRRDQVVRRARQHGDGGEVERPDDGHRDRCERRARDDHGHRGRHQDRDRRGERRNGDGPVGQDEGGAARQPVAQPDERGAEEGGRDQLHDRHDADEADAAHVVRVEDDRDPDRDVHEVVDAVGDDHAPQATARAQDAQRCRHLRQRDQLPVARIRVLTLGAGGRLALLLRDNPGALAGPRHLRRARGRGRARPPRTTAASSGRCPGSPQGRRCQRAPARRWRSASRR